MVCRMPNEQLVSILNVAKLSLVSNESAQGGYGFVSNAIAKLCLSSLIV